MELAITECSSPIVFITKDRPFRFRTDYKKLTAPKTRDSHPLPCMTQYSDSLGKGKIISSLAPYSGYCEIKIEDHDRDETTFTCHHHLYICTRMTCIVEIASVTFWLSLNVLFAQAKLHQALVYMMFILVFSEKRSKSIYLMSSAFLTTISHRSNHETNEMQCFPKPPNITVT